MREEIKNRRRLDRLRKSQPLREAKMILDRDKKNAAMNRKLLATRDKDKDTVVVLYTLPDNELTPWVTWLAPKDAPDKTVLGHYFSNAVDAIHDFVNG